MVREYIGARYVPKFMGTHDNTQAYEALCVVDNGQGTTYISKIPTPAGTPLTNTTYWALYGASSGAIINLQNEIDDINNNTIPAIQSDVTDLMTYNDAEMYAAFKDKKILIVGDSLSDESVQSPNWVARLRTKCADIGTQIDNLSVAGQGWTSPTPNSGGLIDQFGAVTDIYDYIILFAGVNDYNSQVSLGSYGNSTRTTFIGALNELKNVIHTKCPSAIVYYCTSPHTTLWTQAQKPIPHNRYRSRAYNSCKRFGWLMIDTTVLPNYNLIDWQADVSDGIHVKPAYSQILCDHIIKAIIAGGENPAKFANRYNVAFDSPYNDSSLYFDFFNDGTARITAVISANSQFPAGNVTVVANPDGGYLNATEAITIPSAVGNLPIFMWSSGILIKVPANLTGYCSTSFIEDLGYSYSICY